MTARRSIAARLAIAVALILVAGGVVAVIAALAYGRQAADDVYDKLLAGAVTEIARSVEIVDGAPRVDLPVSAFEMLALAQDDRIFYRVVGEDGRTLTGYADLPLRDVEPQSLTFFGTEFRGARLRLVTTKRVVVERGSVETVSVVIGQTVLARTELAWEITRNALAMLGAAGLILIVLTAVAVRLSLSPLSRIEAALLDRNPSDLSPLGIDAPREVDAMVNALDRFMARLARRVSYMQTMIADASHQLRTPVAALRAQAELAVEEDDSDRLRAIAARFHRRAVALGRLTDQLLNQALIIHRSDAVPQHRLDLREVAVRVSQETDHDLLSSDMTLHLDLPEDAVPVVGDALSLVEAVKNLVNNAFRYGRMPVTLSVRREADAAVIAVTDRGSGFDAGYLADTETARFSGPSEEGPEGAGLGLSIVRAVAEAHGGTLQFGPPGGEEFTSSLVLSCAADGEVR